MPGGTRLRMDGVLAISRRGWGNGQRAWGSATCNPVGPPGGLPKHKHGQSTHIHPHSSMHWVAPCSNNSQQPCMRPCVTKTRHAAMCTLRGCSCNRVAAMAATWQWQPQQVRWVQFNHPQSAPAPCRSQRSTHAAAIGLDCPTLPNPERYPTHTCMGTPSACSRIRGVITLGV